MDNTSSSHLLGPRVESHNSLSTFASTGTTYVNVETFEHVTKHVNFNAIPDLAASVRQRVEGAESSDDFHCAVINKPLYGAFNILWPIHFIDNVFWLIKIPATGTPNTFTKQAAEMLTAEARTIQLLKGKVPVPEIYAFEATCDDALGVPYILMEFVDGIPLCHQWFDKSTPPHKLREKNSKTLRQLAKAMLQLGDFGLAEGGSPQFDEKGDLLEAVGPLYLKELAPTGQSEEEGGHSDQAKRSRHLGPFKTTKSFFLAGLKDEGMYTPNLGVRRLIELFVNWIPSTPPDQLPFVLTHPDFNLQNVLVNEDGDLVSLIDWDGVTAMPRCLGNEAYPKWLVKDWNASVYSWIAETDGSEEEDAPSKADRGAIEEHFFGPNHDTNSPEELIFYRYIYETAMMQSKRGMGFMDRTASTTRASLLLNNLYESVQEAWYTETIVEGIFSKIQDFVPSQHDLVKEREASKERPAEHESPGEVQWAGAKETLDVPAQDSLPTKLIRRSLSGMRSLSDKVMESISSISRLGFADSDEFGDAGSQYEELSSDSEAYSDGEDAPIEEKFLVKDEEPFELHTILDALSGNRINGRNLALLKKGFDHFMR